MTSKSMVRLLLFVWFLCLSIYGAGQFQKYRFQQPKMGSPFNIVLYSTDSLAAASAATMAFRYIDTLNLIYSDYLANSELNRLGLAAGNKKWVPVSEILFDILTKAVNASRLSKGYFDVTVKPVVTLWRQARRQKKLPSTADINAAMNKVGYRYIQLDPTHRRARLTRKGMQLDLGGIAKGETAERTVQRLKKKGFAYCLVDAGGDIVAGDVPPGVVGWKIAINLPGSEQLMDKQLLLQNRAVTTSGDLYQYLEVDGKRHSHIINPKTGWALTQNRNVTVISKQGSSADWLTKACSILPVEEALNLVERYQGAAVQIAIEKNGVPFFYRSKGFYNYFLTSIE